MEHSPKRAFGDEFGESIGSLAKGMAMLLLRNEVLDAENEQLKAKCAELEEKLKRHVVKPEHVHKVNLAMQDWTFYKHTKDLYLREVKQLLMKRGSSYATEPEGGPMRAELAAVRETKCVICKEEFDCESIVVVHNCGHMFHQYCVTAQLLRLERDDKLTCPTCRHPVS